MEKRLTYPYCLLQEPSTPKKMTCKELEHTADVRMRITAPNLEKLFIESGFALAKVMYGNYQRDQATVSFPIKSEGDEIEETIINFLSELLFLSETKYLVPVSFDLTVGGNIASGTVSAVLFDPAKHAGGIEVKGITYSGITLEKTTDGYELTIIFDT